MASSHRAMKTEDLERRLTATEALVEDACETWGVAILWWRRGDAVGFARQLRAVVVKLGCAAVALDAIAAECERSSLS